MTANEKKHQDNCYEFDGKQFCIPSCPFAIGDPETDKHGNLVTRGFNADPERDRYFYDFGDGLPGTGWQQWDTDQDASYFGVWVHLETRQTFCYCEGDTTLIDCPTQESFVAQLRDMEEFHGSPPPFAKTIDSDGTLTEHYAKRPGGELTG